MTDPWSADFDDLRVCSLAMQNKQALSVCLSSWGGWQVPSRGPPCYGIFEMQTKPVTTRATATRAGCVRRGLGTPFSRGGSVPAADDDRKPNILQVNTEGLTANKIRDKRYHAASLQEQGIHHRPAGDPLRNCGQASDSRLFTSWVSHAQEARPCHVCPRAVGMVTGRPVSRAIIDWVVVCRRRRI